MWGALSDVRTGLSFTLACTERERERGRKYSRRVGESEKSWEK
jgi:hypothetical protein